MNGMFIQSFAGALRWYSHANIAGVNMSERMLGRLTLSSVRRI